jgi:HAD superfamily hydrolase (TIGR01548 family)
VLARDVDPEWLTRSLAALGIAIRRFPDNADLRDAVRIGLPGDETSFARLLSALATALRPAALLFDMDGVLADVTESYRTAIVETARSFGATVTPAEIAARKALGNANDDWELTRELMANRGVDRPLAEVTTRFEQFYRELRASERLMVAGETLRRWRERYRLAVVTGRPRADAVRFLAHHGITDLFGAIVCREDGPLKPDPAPVRTAMERLAVETAWLLGDTVDDARAARRARALPLGVHPPGDADPDLAAALHAAGAPFVLDRPTDLDALLP